MESFNQLVEEIYRKSIEASEIVSRYARTTPVEESTTFSRLAKTRVLLKYENLQKTGAFKVRGALYKVYRIKDKAKGVVAASAGNHAQGVAFAATTYGLNSIIVMPISAPISKIEATRSYGADIVLYGNIYDEAEEKAIEIAREKNYIFIHPFDDPDIIAGQATIAHELIRQIGVFDTILVPIGGGGLASGISIVLKKLMPNIRIIGVEPENAAKMLASLKEGRPTTINVKPTIADGLATKKPGKLTFKIISRLVDEIVTVSEEEIAHTIYLLLERGKVLVEGAGAAPLAALIHGKIEAKNGRTVVLITGGNIDLNALYRILIRGLARAKRIARITGYVPDSPGQLLKVLQIIAAQRGNILDIIHDRSDITAPAWQAKVTILLEISGSKALEKILKDLESRGFAFKVEE